MNFMQMKRNDRLYKESNKGFGELKAPRTPEVYGTEMFVFYILP
jgi:hypothetical protein